jgi:esterase/lipase
MELNMKIISEIFKINDIPVNAFCKDGATNLPTVFLWHGLTNTRHECIELAHRLAEQDFFTICAEAPKHGERHCDSLQQSGFPNVIKEMYCAIDHAAKEFPQLIDFCKKSPHSDSDRIGITGISMGGLLSFHLAATYPSQISCCVPIIGLPCYVQDWYDILDGLGQRHELQDLDFERFLHTIDPSNNMDNYAPKPLLMLNAEQDTSVPPKYSKMLYDIVSPSYQNHRENLKLEVYNVGHRVIKEMLIEAVSWFNHHMK